MVWQGFDGERSIVTVTASQISLVERILRSDDHVFTATLTPADAKQLLELNTRNRAPRHNVSATYAKDMLEGRWKFTADPLKFDTSGVLLDGQHRLMALESLENQAPELQLKFMFVTGLVPASQKVMDQGAVRTAADNLTMNGLANARDIVAAARPYILWKQDRMFVSQSSPLSKVADTEVRQWVVENPEFVEACQYAVQYRKDIDMSPSLYLCAFYMMYEVDADDAARFLQMWAKGENLSAGHAALALREKLARVRREKRRTSKSEYLAIAITAWNAYRSGTSIKRFPAPSGGTWGKDNFPQCI